MVQENLSPEKEKRVMEKQIDSGMNQEQAQQEVAKEDVEKKTGDSFEKTRRLAIDVMEVNDGLEYQDVGTTAREMADIDSKEVQEMNDKMAQGNLAEEIVQAGLGPQFLSTGANGLERSSRNVAEKSQIYGDGEKMEKMIQEVSDKNPEISREQVEKMTPDELKTNVEEPNTSMENNKTKNEQDNEKGSSETCPENENVPRNLSEILNQGSHQGQAQKNAENLEDILHENSQQGQPKIPQDAFKKKQQNVME